MLNLGFVAVRGAVPGDVLRACQAEIWSVLAARGVRRDDPSTWREPVVRICCHEFPLVPPLSPVELAMTADR